MKAIRCAARFLKHFLFLIPAVLALILFWTLPHFPALTENVFSKGIFRFIAVPLGALTSWLPFSLTELLVIAALPLFIFLAVITVRRILQSPKRLHTAARIGRGVGWCLSCIFLFYMLLHGLNFNRLSVPQLMEMDTSKKTPEFLQAVCIDLASKASAERELLSTDEDEYTILTNSLQQTLQQAGEGYKQLDDRYPFLWGAVNRAKPVQLSHYWSYTGITGMYFPFFSEANVNIDQPDCDIPATAAHELAHTRGFAREDECNFFACLSCFTHPSPDYRYSGYLMAYVYCSNALYAFDEDMWLVTREYCSEGVKEDLRQRNKYWKQFEGKIQKVSNAVNNSFIQSQGVDDGVLSYDRMVELLLAYYEKENILSDANFPGNK